jgi:dienelactone hydrolase
MSDFEPITCEHDGTRMKGFLASPAAAKEELPTVLMFPGATGTGPTFEQTARKLAELGYLAIGINVYDEGADLSTAEAAGKHFMEMLENPDTLRARLVEWFESIAARPDVDSQRMAAIGYCFGGKCVLELARTGADLQVVVSYHGLLTTHAPAQPDGVMAEVVAYCAGRDPYAPIEHFEAFRREMAEAGVKHQLTLFSDAEHSFTDPDHDGTLPGIAYDPQSHRISWAGTLALLDFKLKD